MSYQETIRAKHEFEDSFMQVLKLVSVMERRELELAAAKLGDGIERRDALVDRESALLTVAVIHTVLMLRGAGEISQAKVTRLWLRRKKKYYAMELAKVHSDHDNRAYQLELARVRALRASEAVAHKEQVAAQQRYGKSLPFWARLRTICLYWARPELTPWPIPPVHIGVRAKQINQNHSFSALLAELLYVHRYPHIEHGESYVQEDSIRRNSIKLLSASS